MAAHMTQDHVSEQGRRKAGTPSPTATSVATGAAATMPATSWSGATAGAAAGLDATKAATVGSPLVARDVWAGYGGVDILQGASVEVYPGQISVIVGPNGAGKSTLLKALMGLVQVRQGQVQYGSTDLTALPTFRRVRLGIGYVPQTQNVFPSLSVRENLLLGAFTQPRAITSGLERAFALFPELARRQRQRAGTLSGGERQMLAIARALMLSPRILLLDEPTAALSPAMAGLILDKVASIAQAGVGVGMVEQNARAALAIADHGYVLSLGQNRFTGSGPQLLANQDVVQLFLGG